MGCGGGGTRSTACRHAGRGTTPPARQGGAATPANEFARRLGADREGKIKAVFVTHNETSTGVTSSVAAVRRVLWVACPGGFSRGGEGMWAGGPRTQDFHTHKAIALERLHWGRGSSDPHGSP